jgi:hypothetical protein
MRPDPPTTVDSLFFNEHGHPMTYIDVYRPEEAFRWLHLLADVVAEAENVSGLRIGAWPKLAEALDTLYAEIDRLP